MRRRLVAEEEVSPRGDTFKNPKVRVVKIEAVSLVTLDTPEDAPRKAQDAFARIQPPQGMPGVEIEAWRDSVAKVAIAVKVLPAPKSADVPDDSRRLSEGEKVGTFREEALVMAKETKNDAVVQCASQILDAIGL